MFQPLAGRRTRPTVEEHAEAAALGADFGVEDVDLAVGHRQVWTLSGCLWTR